MENPSGAEKIKPPTGVYLESHYESPARLPNGMAGGLGSAGGAAAPPLLIKGIEESTSSATLIEALQKIAIVTMRQIQYHENEAKKLRAALKPFQAAQPGATPSTEPQDLGEAIRTILAIADKLPQEGEPTP